MPSTPFVQDLLKLDLDLTRDQAAALFDLVDTYTQDVIAEAECDARRRELDSLAAAIAEQRWLYRNSGTGNYVLSLALDIIAARRADVERVRHSLSLAQDRPDRRIRLEALSADDEDPEAVYEVEEVSP